ncbi:hypothetical protein Ancab_005495 [Ancistrocladus abbreviatus]
MSSILGDDASEHLNACLYSVYIGSNDFMLNYFATAGVSTSTRETPEQFIDSLIDQYSKQLKVTALPYFSVVLPYIMVIELLLEGNRTELELKFTGFASMQTLYRYGARRGVVFGLGPLGCLPLFQATGRCEDRINNAIQEFNSRLKSLVDELNKEYPDAQFIFVNTFSIVSPNLSALGTYMPSLSILNVPCCGVGDIYCLPFSVPCRNRNGYTYWDNTHPTEAANKVWRVEHTMRKIPTILIRWI